MFAWFLERLRPEPRYKPGDVVRLPASLAGGFLAIHRRRWATYPQRQWVYDGCVLEVAGNQIVSVREGVCFSETNLEPLLEVRRPRLVA